MADDKRAFVADNFTVERRRLVYDLVGTERTIDVVVQPPVVIAVPVLPDGSILLVDHWRPIMGRLLLECPGGKVQSSEPPAAAIGRELQQEIGYRPTSLERMGSFFTSVGTSTEEIICFLACGLVATHRNPEDQRRMRIRVLTRSEIADLLAEGMLEDGKSEIALSRYLRMTASER